MILTHHSPTTDPRANNPIHQGKDNYISSGFVTDLSLAKCWTSPQIRLWAFRHTQYSFSYQKERTGKLVVVNQGDYNKPGQSTPPFGKVQVVEANDEVWELKTIETQPEAWKPEPKVKLEQPAKKGEWVGEALKKLIIQIDVLYFLVIFWGEIARHSRGSILRYSASVEIESLKSPDGYQVLLTKSSKENKILFSIRHPSV